MLLSIAILLIIATFSSRIAARFGVPGLIIFLALGMLFGSEGLNLITLEDYITVQQIAIAALVIILFEGGLTTKRSQIDIAAGPSISLATIGVTLTAVILGIISHVVLGFDIYSAILIGTIVASTDAAAVFTIFKNRKIDPKTSSTLEIESASNDPVAIILTVTMIGLILDTLDSASILILNLLWQILAGVLIGVIIGYLAPYLINRLKLESGGFYYVLALSLCFLSYGLADEIYANGFLAVFITGLIIGNREVIYKQGILRFLDGTSTFSQVLLFLMLGLLVTPSELVALWKEGVVVAIILIFVARPLAVLLCTIFWKYSIQQRLFLTWGGIKGAVPIVLATYPSAAGMEDGTFYFHIVFFVVLFSALVQGSTIDIVAKKLGLLTGMKNHPLHSMELLSLERSKSELLELEVLPENSIIDRKIQDLNLPPNCLITAIVRESEITTPRGQTKIKSGDILFVLTRYKDKDKLLEVLDFD